MPIPLFNLLSLSDSKVTPSSSKIHLACWNGKEHPLDVYLAGHFEEWQSWQNQKNFQRPFVISLIQYRSNNRWLFAGVYDSLGCQPHGDVVRYDLKERTTCTKYRGRVIVDFARSFRNSYPNGETCDENLIIQQLLPEPLTIADFPGYRKVNISKSILDTIFRIQPESWRTALSSVAGVYVISDTKKGDLYVGSATGEGGIWQRWSSYAKSGHGDNKLLRELLINEGADRSSDFRFSILEIADIHDSEADLLQRESFWKVVLLTRDHGLNAN